MAEAIEGRVQVASILTISSVGFHFFAVKMAKLLRLAATAFMFLAEFSEISHTIPAPPYMHMSLSSLVPK